MYADWIGGSKKQKKRQDAAQAKQTRKAYLIFRWGLQTFDALKAAVKRHIDEVNRQNFDGKVTLELGYEMGTLRPGHFLVRKLGFPALKLTVNLSMSSEMPAINYELAGKSEKDPYYMPLTSGAILLDAGDAENVILRVDGNEVSIDQASETLLRSIVARAMSV